MVLEDILKHEEHILTDVLLEDILKHEKHILTDVVLEDILTHEDQFPSQMILVMMNYDNISITAFSLCDNLRQKLIYSDMINDGYLPPTARQQGTVARQQGTVPRQQGTVARQQGTVARQQGTVPRQQGTVARQQGTVPRQQGTVPRQQGTVPRQQGTVGVHLVSVSGGESDGVVFRGHDTLNGRHKTPECILLIEKEQSEGRQTVDSLQQDSNL